ncbi:PAS domain-containing sensor histidine kinase [Novosphingobium terrae]|uniref:PAS domain-containing sensor histidine kinase n=1 Tax=Novosphingobium terrae TaxID=2726189 RepID=UPI001981A90E|nr:PAS domain-containing protein [Novosphingobium terrae]
MPISLVPRLAGKHGQTMSDDMMLNRVRDFDWSSTLAGPLETWPEELRAVCRTILSSSIPMAVLIGRQGVVMANNALRLLFGPKYDHGLGLPVGDVLLHSAAFVDDMLDRAFRGFSSRFQDIILPISDPVGVRQAWFDLEFTPVTAANGDILGTLVVCIETTVQKQALIDVEKARERLDLALSSGGVVGVWEIDFKHETVRSDARYALLHNVDPEIAAVGAHRDLFIAGIHPDDLNEVMAAFDEAKISGRYHCQHRVVGRDGTRWIIASGRVKHDQTGAPTSFTGTAVDVTELFDMAAELAESEKRFRTYAETLPHVIFQWDDKGCLTYFNHRWREFTGYDDSYAGLWEWQNFVHPDEQPFFFAEWSRATATQERFSFEARYRHASGTYRWMRTVALPLQDAEGLTGWIGTLTDVHEEKNAEVERELVSRELDHRIKNFFALTQSLVNITSRESLDTSSFAKRLQGRLIALHQSHDLIRQGAALRQPESGMLHALFKRLLAPYVATHGAERIIIEGCDVPLRDNEITSFSLVFHELTTNAAKYGALSTEQGRLLVSFEFVDGALSILWQETNAHPAPSSGESGGFGSTLINLIIERQMNGRFERTLKSDGLTIRVTVPR